MVHCSRINAGAKGAQAWQGSPWRFSGLREDPRGAGASRAVKHQQGMNSRLMEQETPEAAPGRWEMVLRLVLGPPCWQDKSRTSTEESIPELLGRCQGFCPRICAELVQNETSWSSAPPFLCALGQTVTSPPLTIPSTDSNPAGCGVPKSPSSITSTPRDTA